LLESTAVRQAPVRPWRVRAAVRACSCCSRRCAGRVRRHRLDEPSRRLLEQGLQRSAVRVAEGGAAARAALQDPAPGHARSHRLDALVQPNPTALDAGLRQPDAVRRKLAGPINPGKPVH